MLGHPLLRLLDQKETAESNDDERKSLIQPLPVSTVKGL